ncbi:hypothetical protein [Phyllobacterium sp. SB3]|uniref:hypothetical protein n=1 Tax=Phyllobacterium sp. SB3 TaxID=3156073 RepID=UPI0032AEFC78
MGAASDLRFNRLAFSYPAGAGGEITGDRNLLSTEAPFQKFLWTHFPYQPADGINTYRAAKQYMPRDGRWMAGTSSKLDIQHAAVTYEVSARCRAHAQPRFFTGIQGAICGRQDIIPGKAKDGLDFAKPDARNARGQSIYEWFGFEARDLFFDFIEKARWPSLNL